MRKDPRFLITRGLWEWKGPGTLSNQKINFWVTRCYGAVRTEVAKGGRSGALTTFHEGRVGLNHSKMIKPSRIERS